MTSSTTHLRPRRVPLVVATVCGLLMMGAAGFSMANTIAGVVSPSGLTTQESWVGPNASLDATAMASDKSTTNQARAGRAQRAAARALLGSMTAPGATAPAAPTYAGNAGKNSSSQPVRERDDDD